MKLARVLFCAAVLVAFSLFLARQPQATGASQDDSPAALQMAAIKSDRQPPSNLKPQTATPCVAGFAGSYACNNIDLLAYMPLSSIGGGGNTNDIWGWTDPQTGTEYALVGKDNGTAFVDISDPENPVYLGTLPVHGSASLWRGLKVYEDYLFTGTESSNGNLQIFDLTELRDVVSPPVTFTETDFYNGFGSSHTIALNEDTGFVYAAGSNTCSGGLHMVNVQDPLNATNAGCFSSDGYTHETQCVTYHGPDTDYTGHEICFNSNEDTLTIVDVTNKSLPDQLSRTGYAGSGYTHQGWLTEDQTYFLLDDEFDESNNGHNTRTYIWDVSDLDDPEVIDHHDGPTPAIDHNQYVRGNYLYQSNYTAGLYILDLSDVANGNLTQVAFFDVYPSNNSTSYNGSWTNYPYFESGVVIANSIDEGFFILQPHLYTADLTPTSTESAMPGETVTHHFTLENTGLDDGYTLSLEAGNWSTTLLTSSPISLTSGTTTTIAVEVDIPALETVIDSDTFTLTVTSDGNPGLVLTAVGQTDAVAEPGVTTSADQNGSGVPGNEVHYTLTITNTGNYTDSFAVSVTGNAWSTVPSANPVGPLAPGQSTTIHVAVTIGSGVSDTATVTFTSSLDDAVTADVTLTTTATSSYDIYLPVIRTDN